MNNINIALKKWTIGATLPNDRPLLIAGPCSAETESQVIETCLRLKQTGKAHILRAGIWKPRTRPNSFEGVGSIGLAWLKQAGLETGLPVTTEVATARHAEEALKSGIDILWIGARTTANPFSVQEIADALRGTNIPVMVKNPVNPDLALWIGALERLNKVGIEQLAAIHRGFSSYGEKKYRNTPQWEIPIELMRRLPDLPIINDPSHITGNRHLLAEIAQKAMDLNFDGLMVESHIAPDLAWSDAEQQCTPEVYAQWIDQLILRQPTSQDVVFRHTLDDLRCQIDQLDQEIVQLLANRMKIAFQIGEAKRANNIQILQPQRWQLIIEQRAEAGAKQGLSKTFVEAIYNAIHNESIHHQTQAMNNCTEKTKV